MDKLVRRTLLAGCIMFTCFMTLFCLVGVMFIGPDQGIVYSLTILLATFVLAALQAIWFTDRVITRLSYPLRILGFGICGYAAVAGCALLGAWMPTAEPGAWVSFSAVYLVILIVACIGYQIHFKRTAGSYDAALRAYHERMGK